VLGNKQFFPPLGKEKTCLLPKLLPKNGLTQLGAVFGACLYSRTKGGVEFFDSIGLHRLGNMGIEIKRGRDRAMPQTFLGDFWVYPLH